MGKGWGKTWRFTQNPATNHPALHPYTAAACRERAACPRRDLEPTTPALRQALNRCAIGPPIILKTNFAIKNQKLRKKEPNSLKLQQSRQEEIKSLTTTMFNYRATVKSNCACK